MLCLCLLRLVTKYFIIVSGWLEYNQKYIQSSPAGNRTPVSRVTGGDTQHYTTKDLGWQHWTRCPVQFRATVSKKLGVCWFWNKLCSKEFIIYEGKKEVTLHIRLKREKESYSLRGPLTDLFARSRALLRRWNFTSGRLRQPERRKLK